MKTFLKNSLMLAGLAALFIATALPVEAARTGGTTIIIITTPKPVVSAF